MTYPNDPGTNPRRYDRINNATSVWVLGALAILAVLGILMFASSDNTRVATNNPPVTTGSGTTAPRVDPVQPNNPAGNMPTAPAPAINR